MALDLEDLVQVDVAVGGVDLDQVADHALAVVPLRSAQERQEHALARMGVEVGRAGLRGLAEDLQVLGHVAQRVGALARPEALGDDGQVDLEGGHDHPRGDRRLGLPLGEAEAPTEG